ncbi:MAG: hypothetical protein F2694_12095 [Actinobacteria bacterium]|uniref:Unannotated protein n=1 Tax=freshwater metagenome TaxID=449393 RepID=A0A6J6UVP6_9ZZZZ|nr:hypothetical protein [Actinomycetota bacterium]
MSTSSRTSGISKRAVVAGLLAALLLSLLLAACGDESSSKDSSTTTAAKNSDWKGTALLCSGDVGAAVAPTAQELIDLAPGAVMSLGDDPSGLVAAAGCTEAEGADRPVPSLSAGSSYFAVGTGVDRFEVVLTGVEAVKDTTTLQVKLTVPGDNCMTTMEYRGRLTLLVQAPQAAPMPQIDFVTEQTVC